MEVILLEKVDNLGNLGDRVKVRNGYARNYLIPKGKAKPATEENIKAFEAMRAELEAKAAEARAAAEARKAQIEALGRVTLARRTAGENKLFGSVGTVDIAEALEAAGVPVRKAEIRLPQGNIRETGEHLIRLHLHSDVEFDFTVVVVPEE